MLSFIFELFDLYEKYVSKGMSIRILISNFHVLCHRIIKVGPVMYVNFVL